MPIGDTNREAVEMATKIHSIKGELKEYEERCGLKGLEGRIQRGLDPASMLAVKETREKLQKVAKKLGVGMDSVEKLTNELHVGAIWSHADELAEGKDPAIQTWMVAGEATTSGKEQEGDLSEAEFINDLARVNGLLEEAVGDTETFAERARHNLVDSSKGQFTIKDSIPVSDLDSGFLAMAINGHKAGIVKDKDGLLFVGANEFDYATFSRRIGLKSVQKEDRGRVSTFYQDREGIDVVKQLYPGFAIVLNKDMEVANQLARSGMKNAQKENIKKECTGMSKAELKQKLAELQEQQHINWQNLKTADSGPSNEWGGPGLKQQDLPRLYKKEAELEGAVEGINALLEKVGD